MTLSDAHGQARAERCDHRFIPPAMQTAAEHARMQRVHLRPQQETENGMIANLEIREDVQLWLALENNSSAEVELQALDVALAHSGKEYEGEVLPYKKLFPAGERTALNLSKFVSLHLQMQRAQSGAPVQVTCRLLAFAENPEDASAPPASLTVIWRDNTFSLN